MSTVIRIELIRVYNAYSKRDNTSCIALRARDIPEDQLRGLLGSESRGQSPKMLDMHRFFEISFRDKVTVTGFFARYFKTIDELFETSYNTLFRAVLNNPDHVISAHPSTQ